MSLHASDWAKLIGAGVITALTGGAGAPLLGAAAGSIAGGSQGAVNGALGGSLTGLGAAGGGAMDWLGPLLQQSASAATPKNSIVPVGQVPDGMDLQSLVAQPQPQQSQGQLPKLQLSNRLPRPY